MLDSLARFYNSEITVHVGYELTLSAFVIGTAVGLFTSVLLRSEEIRLPTWFPFQGASPWLDGVVRIAASIMLLVATLVYFRASWIPYSFKYLFGRTQLYHALFEIVSEHMGLTERGEPVKSGGRIQKMMDRALRNGIRTAIFTLFEARLLLSRYARIGRPIEDLFKKEEEVKEENRDWVQRIKKKLKDAYDVGPDELFLLSGAYKRQILRFNFEDALYLAYKSQVDEYCKGNNDRGLLLKRAFDP